jgi:uncharacterized protein (TIGR02646 family)
VIPVAPQPESPTFNEEVRVPGDKFLRKLGNLTPTYKQWIGHNYWKYIRYDLHDAYNGICSYCANWIPRGESSPTIDHFIPKSIRPDLAYEWSNYRLACPLINTRKKDYQDVLDPFTLHYNWFFLDFPTLLLKPNPELSVQDQQRVWRTIKRLKLNEDETFIHSRNHWLEAYCREHTPYSFLKKHAPFVAYELERQDLVDSIKTIMDYGPESE